ncbi:MAG: enoyl-CoA hydratase-related protein [Pseudomonadota bacterium]
MSSVEISRQGPIAVLTLNAPPANALGQTLRRHLGAAIAVVTAEPGILGCVIAGAGHCLSAGADIRELDAGQSARGLGKLLNRIELCPKPVVAAVHGPTLGAGLELALACHYRVASPTALVGMPEVKLGLLPAGGATQRLPRLCGAANALRIMAKCRSLSASEAQKAGLIDQVAPRKGATAEAVRYLEKLLAEGKSVRPSSGVARGLSEPKSYLAHVAQWRKSVLGEHPSALSRIVDCVEAALLLPFAAGLEFEAVALADCRESRDSQAMRHLYFSERRAQRFDPPPSKSAITEVAVVGGGKTGVSLVRGLLDAGLQVKLIDPDAARRDHAVRLLSSQYGQIVQNGRMSAATRDKRLAGITVEATGDHAATADIVIEAFAELTEDYPELRGDVLNALSQKMRQDAVLASICVSLDPNNVLPRLVDKTRFLGLHLPGPFGLTRSLELVPTMATDPSVTALFRALIVRLRKVPILTAPTGCFPSNALLEAFRFGATSAVAAGASPETVDAALRDFGFQRGPFETMDGDGFAAVLRSEMRWRDSAGVADNAFPIVRALHERGVLAGNTGQGFFLQNNGGTAEPNPIANEEIEALRRSVGLRSRSVSTSEIVERCMAALINEGASVLRRGLARCPSDLDFLASEALGFPAWEGGPMYLADRRRLSAVRAALQRLAPEAKYFWQPDPLIEALISEGQSFASRNP